MIDEHNALVIPGTAGHKDIAVEINWNPSAKENRMVKLKIGDQETIVKYEDLYNFLFVMGNTEEQQQMMPVRHVKVTRIHKQHRVKLTKALKAGEELVVNCKLDVPTMMYDALRIDFDKRKELISLL